MTGAAPQSELARRVGALVKPRPGVDPAEIAEIVQEVLTSMDLDFTAANLKVYAEIQALSQFIHDLKADLAALRPDEVTDEHLPAANDELEAVVGATEQATNEIFEAVEAIETLTGRMDEEVSAQVSDAVTKVYEACGFQDITGQRITKVVGALREIEAKMQGLLEAFGEGIRKLPRERPAAEPASDKDLMNGPQMPEAAKNQDDIDAILAGFD